MKLDWHLVKLSQICDFRYGKNLTEKSRLEGPYPVYGSSAIISYHNNFLVKGPGIIIGRKGTVGKVQYSKKSFFPIDTTFYVEIKNHINLKFLYYRLLICGFETMNSDAAVPGLKRIAAINQTIHLPPLPIQKKIATILSNYDNLIENNCKRIRLLEEMAQITYEEWFVHCRFPGYQSTPIDKKTGLPKGWEKIKLQDVAIIKWGDASTTKKKYTSTGYTAYSASGPDGFLSYFDYDQPAVILSAIGAYSGLTWLALGKWSAIKNTMVFWARQDMSVYYLYFSTKFSGYWSKRGSAQPFIALSDAKLQKLYKPAYNLLSEFDNICKPIYSEIFNLNQQNQLLKEARDILLPRLMTGIINVEKYSPNIHLKEMACVASTLKML